MITLIVVKNPFKTDREIKQIAHISGQTLLDYITPQIMGFEEFVVTHNGEIVEPDKYGEIIPNPEDFMPSARSLRSGDVGKDIAGRGQLA